MTQAERAQLGREVERLREEVAELRAFIRRGEWKGTGTVPEAKAVKA